MGGECPLPDGTLHEVQLEGGAFPPRTMRDDDPESWNWHDDACRIIAYRVIEPASEPTDDGVLTGAALHRAIADAMDAGEGPEAFEFTDAAGNWETADCWSIICVSTIRRKPTTRHLIDQSGVRHEWPEPMSKAPPHETEYWVSDLTAPSLVLAKRWQKWISTGYDIEMGIAHLRKKDVQAQSKALIAASGGNYGQPN